MAPTVLSQQAPWCFTKLLPVRSKTKTLLLQRPPSSSLFFLQLQKYHPTLMKLQQPPSSHQAQCCLYLPFPFFFSSSREKTKKKKQSQKLPNCQTSVTSVSTATLFILHLHPLNLVNLWPYYQGGLFHTLLAPADGECSEKPARHN